MLSNTFVHSNSGLHSRLYVSQMVLELVGEQVRFHMSFSVDSVFLHTSQVFNHTQSQMTMYVCSFKTLCTSGEVSYPHLPYNQITQIRQNVRVLWLVANSTWILQSTYPRGHGQGVMCLCPVNWKFLSVIDEH